MTDDLIHDPMIVWFYDHDSISAVCFLVSTNVRVFPLLQDSFKEPSDSSESDSSLSQSPNMQDWLAQARSTRSLQHQDTLQKQRVGYFFEVLGFKWQYDGSKTITIVLLNLY